jgi:hypothetical protein
MVLAQLLAVNDTVYLIGAVAAGTSAIMIYLQSKFSEQKQLVYDTRRIFYRIISLHNHEDDDRFAELKNDIWRLRVRNATKDGEEFPEPDHFVRRRYLTENLTENGEDILESP